MNHIKYKILYIVHHVSCGSKRLTRYLYNYIHTLWYGNSIDNIGRVGKS